MEDIDPLFHLNEVIPTKITEHPALIPYLLSTQVEKRQVAKTDFHINSSAGENIDTVLKNETEESLAASLTTYNDNLEELLANLPNKRRKYE